MHEIENRMQPLLFLPQIHGGPQIFFRHHRWASLNLREIIGRLSCDRGWIFWVRKQTECSRSCFSHRFMEARRFSSDIIGGPL